MQSLSGATENKKYRAANVPIKRNCYRIVMHGRDFYCNKKFLFFNLLIVK